MAIKYCLHCFSNLSTFINLKPFVIQFVEQLIIDDIVLNIRFANLMLTFD